MIEQYNYSHLISKDDQKKAIKLVDSLFKSGNWCQDENIPKFQTWPNLYEYQEFKIFKDTFVNSCIQYLDLNFKPYYKLTMWVFKDNRFNNKRKNQSEQWHEHSCGNKNKISGVYYLRNLRNEGTQFKDFNIIPKQYTWHIYPSYLLHKPPVIKSFRNRYTIVADFEY